MTIKERGGIRQIFDFSENESGFGPDDVVRNGIAEVAVVANGGAGASTGQFYARFDGFDGFVFTGRAVIALSHECHFGIDVGSGRGLASVRGGFRIKKAG